MAIERQEQAAFLVHTNLAVGSAFGGDTDAINKRLKDLESR